jgi:hypothetical protein
VKINVEWADFKTQLAAGLVYKYVDVNNVYYIYAVDGGFSFECIIPKNSNADQTDFETNYKAAAFTTFSQFDTDGASIVRNKAAKRGWTFCSLPIEFQTSRLATGNTSGSDDMYSKDSAGTTRSFISLKIYDNSDVEITTPGVLNANYANAVKTVIDFEPPYDYEVIGGDIRTLTTISNDIRLWIIAVPDIAAPTGSKEMGGGVNLKYLAPGNVWSVDGRVTKFATYNATYHTNKLRMVLKYPAGTNENLQVIIQMYKA